MIPKNITKNDLIKAIQYLDLEGIPDNRKSKKVNWRIPHFIDFFLLEYLKDILTGSSGKEKECLFDRSML